MAETETKEILLAPNGRPSKLSPELYKLVRTVNFINWFGDWINTPSQASKVVDENGEPMVVYHYSPNDFSVFDKKQHISFIDITEQKKHTHLGYDFSTKKDFYKSKDRNKTYEVFLNARNVFNFKTATDDEIKKIKSILLTIPYFAKSEFNLNSAINGLNNGDWGILELPSLEKYFSKKYDALFMTENDWLNIKVYNPNQIKLATGENITFDSSDDDIRFKEGGMTSKNNVELLAPNGKPSNLNKVQYKLVRSKEFINWFGDWINTPSSASKVVDENGEPMVVYHGTNYLFNEFKFEKIGTNTDFGMWGKGFYFSPSKKFSKFYGNKVMNLFLNIKNPFIVNPVKYKIPDDLKPVIGENNSEKLRNKLIDLGYDGVFQYERGEKNPLTQIITFEPNQIKLATGENTQFNPNDNDIRYKEGGELSVNNSSSIETMDFWHGGNLDDYDDVIAQKNGRYEYGAGLYLTTHYETAKKYAKGSRKLYLVTVQKGVDLQNSKLNYNDCVEFIKSYVIGSKRKEIIARIEKYNIDGQIKGYLFNNILLNEKAIKSSSTSELRNFLITQGVDYELVDNPFGWHEMMMVLYNMKKIVKTKIITSKDKLDEDMFNLPTTFSNKSKFADGGEINNNNKIMNKPIEQNFTQFAIANGYPSDYDILNHGRLGPSGYESKRQKSREMDAHLDRLYKNKEAHRLYNEAIQNGTIIDPSGEITKKQLDGYDYKEALNKLKSKQLQLSNYKGILERIYASKLASPRNNSTKQNYKNTVDELNAINKEIEQFESKYAHGGQTVALITLGGSNELKNAVNASTNVGLKKFKQGGSIENEEETILCEFIDIIYKSKSEAEAFESIRKIKNVPSDVANYFSETYNPDDNLSMEKAFSKFYNKYKNNKSNNSKMYNIYNVSNEREELKNASTEQVKEFCVNHFAKHYSSIGFLEFQYFNSWSVIESYLEQNGFLLTEEN